MDYFKRIALTFLFALALFAGDAFAQCGGKVVYIELPATWGTTTFVLWEGQFVPVTGVKEGSWTKFTLPPSGTTTSVSPPSLGNDGPNKKEIIFLNKAENYLQAGISYVTATTISTSQNLPSGEAHKFTCSQFGDNGTWIIENPSKPEQTAISTQPPNAYYFYFLPPKATEWALGIPYIAWREGGTIKKEKLTLDSRCGWYKMVYFDKNPPDADAWVWLNGNKAEPDDQIGDLGLDEDPMDWKDGRPTPFNLAQRFGGKPGDLFLVAQDGWTTIDPYPGRKGVCEYTFAAIIYDTDSDVSSAFVDAAGAAGTSGTGVAKEIPKSVLKDGKMEFNLPKDNWTQQTFTDAFKSTPGKNVVRCYDMPFKRNKNGLWEYNSNRLCTDGSMDLDGDCDGGKYMGGYFPPELQTRGTADYSQCPSCDKKRKAESWVPIDRKKQSQYCYDRALVGTGDEAGSCSTTALGVEGDFRTGDEPLKTQFWDWGNRPALTIADKNEFFCFESMPAPLFISRVRNSSSAVMMIYGYL